MLRALWIAIHVGVASIYGRTKGVFVDSKSTFIKQFRINLVRKEGSSWSHSLFKL